MLPLQNEGFAEVDIPSDFLARRRGSSLTHHRPYHGRASVRAERLAIDWTL